MSNAVDIRSKTGSTDLQALARFKDLFNVLNRHSISRDLLETVYAHDAKFQDSLHSVEGLDAIESYFTGLYENVTSIEFEWHDESVSHGLAFVDWTMRYAHPSINGGRAVEVRGASRLKISEGRISDHRDFFDAGEMLYENLPILGFAIRKLKKRLA